MLDQSYIRGVPHTIIRSDDSGFNTHGDVSVIFPDYCEVHYKTSHSSTCTAKAHHHSSGAASQTAPPAMRRMPVNASRRKLAEERRDEQPGIHQWLQPYTVETTAEHPVPHRDNIITTQAEIHPEPSECTIITVDNSDVDVRDIDDIDIALDITKDEGSVKSDINVLTSSFLIIKCTIERA